jgi:hypothetical protein
LRDVAATVVTGGGAFAWVKLFNWFASKEVFDRVRRRRSSSNASNRAPFHGVGQHD